MKEPVVIIGRGGMSGLFTRGLLRSGRLMSAATRRVLVMVAEKNLQPALTALPAPWRGRPVLLQKDFRPVPKPEGGAR